MKKVKMRSDNQIGVIILIMFIILLLLMIIEEEDNKVDCEQEESKIVCRKV